MNMKKVIIILVAAVVVSNGCGGCKSNQKTVTEILPEELIKIPFHTTNYRVYCGSDSLFHYFRHYHLIEGEKRYKISRDKFIFAKEIPYSENPKLVFFSMSFDEEKNVWRGDFFIENETISNE